MADAPRDVASWRIILAFILDLITAFIVFGYLVAKLFGGLTDNGFKLEGWPAVLMFLLIVGYFVVCGRYLGGRLWQRILGAVR